MMNIPGRTDALPSMLPPLPGTYRRRPVLLVLVLFAVVFWAGEAKSFGQIISTSWAVSEFQPDIRQGGRANTIAVHPANNDIILVTSESGGLFRSADRGRRWRHVDSLPCFLTNSVAFAPNSPDVLLVTTGDDFKTTGGGGVWRSTDGGVTWAQSSVTFPVGITGRLQGYEISIAPDNGAIYVAIEFGVLMSSNNGASWTFQDVFGGSGNRRVVSIVALGNDVVLAGGPAGIRRSTDGGQIWTSPATGVGAVADLHAFGSSPHSRQHAYVVNGATQLFRTEDSGNNWTRIASAPAGGGGCGGISFVKAVPFTSTILSGLTLYFGNRCGVARLLVPIILSIPDYSLTWENLNIDHGDTRHIAFDTTPSARPLLLGTDGGLHQTADAGANWSYVGGGRDGFNALQITEVKGQYIEDLGRHDLYFGTQDNDLWSSGDGGMTWGSGRCCEGFFIEAQRRVATASLSKVTSVACNACVNGISDPLFSNTASWPNPAGTHGGVNNPMIVRRSMHLQGVDNSGGFSKGLGVTSDLGTNWRQFATFAEDRRDLPKLGRPGGLFTSTIVYQAYRAPGWGPGFEINHLTRIRKRFFNSTATVFFPAMNNFGGLGLNATMFAWYQVFASDPGDAFHVMAADVINQRVMETRDGGENWTEVTQLTNLVTDGGRLLFNSGIKSLVTAISFSPQDPRLVLAGTSEGGIYHSTDNGAHWARIPGSELVTFVTAFHWRASGDVIVSTYGRGLWKLRSQPVIPREDVERECRPPCVILPPCLDPPCRSQEAAPPPPYERAILIYEGEVQGARAEAGVLREVFVTPGSSALFAAETQKVTTEITVTPANDKVGYSGLPSPPDPPKEGWIIKGLVFGKDNRLAGMVFGDQPMVMIPPESDKDIEGSIKSPIAGKPYLQIGVKRYNGAPTAEPGEVIQITGTNFPRDANLEITMDGRPSGYKIKVDGQGLFSAQIPAPLEMGLHSLVIYTGDGKKTVLDGSMFLVKHVDEPKKDN